MSAIAARRLRWAEADYDAFENGSPEKHEYHAREETGKIAWEVPQSGPVDGKRVAGLLFHGDPNGYFIAADERDRKTLWRLPLRATRGASQ